MARKASNSLLHKAKESKSDEFYTQYCDIERELQHYKSQFIGKVVYCNCDDPYKSNFFNYFINNFKNLQIKKVVASCFRNTKGDLFCSNKEESGIYLEYSGETLKDGLCSLPINHFKGNGDFRSEECIEILKKSDVIVTNPPFSLFREFVAQMIRYNKKFLIIGNINAITYKEIFQLIQENKVWLGQNLGRGISGFIVPEHYQLYGTETRIDENGNRIISTNNCLWLTNLDSAMRNESLKLTKKYQGAEQEYPFFDNYNGINVNRTQDIPMDYGGVMGVPITFLHKYNPLQFEIIQFRKGDDGKDLSVNGKYPYFRILIRNKQTRDNLIAHSKATRISKTIVAENNSHVLSQSGKGHNNPSSLFDF